MNMYRTPRTVDISDLVRVRKHVSGSSVAMGIVSFFCLMLAVAWALMQIDPGSSRVEGGPAILLLAVPGTLALATTIASIKGRLAALPALAVATLVASVGVTARLFTALRPINDDEIVVLVAAAGGIPAALHLLWTVWSRFFASARRSPYVGLLFASNRSLGENYAGRALSWTEWIRQLRPWAVAVGVLTYVAAFGIAAMLNKGKRNQRAERQIAQAILSIGGTFFVWTKRKSALRGGDKRRIDCRAPVLLLRSFDDDMMIIRKGAKESSAADLHRYGMTFERVVEDYLSPFGPFVGIGRPDEPLSPLGAARDYVPDETWQVEVEQRLRDASIIVLIIGTSQGLAWELRRVGDLMQLHKLILLFPPSEDVESRWQTLLARDRAAMESVLPDTIDPARTLALIYADDLTPIIIEGKRDERSYEVALRLGGMLAITTGAEPAVAASASDPLRV